ncbi:hypothetical protein [Pontibacillus yanchengensis]|uniref:Uncharacterized protein n=1 Tax=Pontibacillus yanchengensis Y32 TaxID=1385514 RepID=A0A0A2TB72_9BACI|nr:hypothetical protein [Pontibacillus yanchengensis]KGP71673.1 hypothetical protein N782_17705 [Pontibacillus yanchengensis Y32]
MKKLLFLIIVTAFIGSLFIGFVMNTDYKATGSDKSSDLYKGTSLKIAIIGAAPNVKEDQINFHEIKLSEVVDFPKNKYNAIFIMEENLAEAADKKYRNAYRSLEVPVFFVGSKASHMPFINMENQISYKEYVDRVNDNQHFITGLWYPKSKDTFKAFKFGYPVENDEYQRDKVQEVYSSVFKKIESILQ